TDFIDCADHLIAKDYTRSDRLIARGGSAGGLLMGAVINMRPDLFHAVIAQVPFVDALNTMLDDTLPLTTVEYNEWGNPNEPEFYDYIKSYSPYDNTVATAYPHLLITGGLNDPRVTYWEPTKWIAKLRAVRTNDRLLLMDMKMGAGHGGASGRFEHLQDTALEWAFALKALGKVGNDA
ncbi:MAG: prolyl oligopeptidase family serine peptidase, partial [Candidatus Latescibacterota bacterium]|nr:prolyl oligopeptidase family serine peptidase [Candidatus Latescibacterota bacterium]